MEQAKAKADRNPLADRPRSRSAGAKQALAPTISGTEATLLLSLQATAGNRSVVGILERQRNQGIQRKSVGAGRTIPSLGQLLVQREVSITGVGKFPNLENFKRRYKNYENLIKGLQAKYEGRSTRDKILYHLTQMFSMDLEFESDQHFRELLEYHIENKTTKDEDLNVQEQYLSELGWTRRAKAKASASVGKQPPKSTGDQSAKSPSKSKKEQGGGSQEQGVKLPSLKVYRTMKIAEWAALKNKEYDKLGAHLGDFQQSLAYLFRKSEPKVLIEFTLRPGSERELFSPANISFPDTRAVPKLAPMMNTLVSENPSSQYAQDASSNEGYAGDKIGLKAEDKTEAGFSFGIGGPKAANRFMSFVADMRVIGSSKGDGTVTHDADGEGPDDGAELEEGFVALDLSFEERVAHLADLIRDFKDDDRKVISSQVSTVLDAASGSDELLKKKALVTLDELERLVKNRKLSKDRVANLVHDYLPSDERGLLAGWFQIGKASGVGHNCLIDSLLQLTTDLAEDDRLREAALIRRQLIEEGLTAPFEYLYASYHTRRVLELIGVDPSQYEVRTEWTHGGELQLAEVEGAGNPQVLRLWNTGGHYEPITVTSNLDTGDLADGQSNQRLLRAIRPAWMTARILEIVPEGVLGKLDHRKLNAEEGTEKAKGGQEKPKGGKGDQALAPSIKKFSRWNVSEGFEGGKVFTFTDLAPDPPLKQPEVAPLLKPLLDALGIDKASIDNGAVRVRVKSGDNTYRFGKWPAGKKDKK